MLRDHARWDEIILDASNLKTQPDGLTLCLQIQTRYRATNFGNWSGLQVQIDTARYSCIQPNSRYNGYVSPI